MSPSAAGGRLTFVAIAPGVAPGLLTWPAWQVVREAREVLGRDVDPTWVQALADAGVAVHDVGAMAVDELARRLVASARDEAAAVWLLSPDGDPGLAERVTEIALRAPDQHVELELVLGSYDLPGARLLELVAVMDRLRSPGGCPWDAEQTHESLVPYALEEAFELAEAVETGDRQHVREELGDLLLQVAFHARVAAEHPDDPFSIDDVADGIVTKLRRRHPHVFADGTASTPDEVEVSWHEIKASEKGRASVVDGIPVALPALARADKVLGRLERAGVDLADVEPPDGVDAVDVGARLLAVVVAARSAGVDPEAALRARVRQLEERARGLPGQG